MAATVRGRRLTEAHRLAQQRLATRAVAQVRVLWPLLDPGNLDRTSARWLQVNVPMIGAQRRQSAQLAARYLQSFRRFEAPDAAAYRPTPVFEVPVDQVVRSLQVTGPVSVKQSIARGVPVADAMRAAESKVAGAAVRHVLDGGRETVMQVVEEDDEVVAVARITSGDPCAFCAMLASRGPVYKSEGTASFRPHDRCSCQPEPSYGTPVWHPNSLRLRRLWDRATYGSGGGKHALNAFRRELAGG